METLEDIAPFVVDHLLPEIKESVEVCVSSFEADDFNDSWTFGTQLWRNTWNRIKSVAQFEDCPFDIHGKGNEYKLKIGQYILRHHKIDNVSKMPTGAKAVKSSAYTQMSIFSLLGYEPTIRPSIENIVIAIDASIQKGLKEVFLGELMPLSLESKKFKWVNKVPIYLAEGEESSTSEIVYISTPIQTPHVSVEKVPEVTMKLVQTNANEKKANRDFEK